MPFDRVRTRIAPSPTGIAHLGTLYTALFNYAFAKQQGGDFIVRSEDTDRSRFVAGAEDIILDALTWVGIQADESVRVGGPYGPYRQSERLDIYRSSVEQLIKEGKAYYCFATTEELTQMRLEQQQKGLPPKYDGRYRDYSLDQALTRIAAGESYVVRLRVPAGECRWTDLIRGEVVINYAQIDDQVLLKADGFPTYHLAVVVDDHLMRISHVMRGEEWISSTPKHLLLYQMFGWEPPQFAHSPLLRNPDHSKLSKRKNDVSVVSYRERGYLPEALLNFFMLLGWSHPEGKEFLSLEEFIHDFAIERMQKTGPIFDIEKLNWMNGKYIREKLSTNELKQSLEPFLPQDLDRQQLDDLLPLVRERLVTLQDFEPLTVFFYRDITVDPAALQRKATPELVKTQLAATIATLSQLTDWQDESIEAAIRTLQEKQGWSKSQYFMMLRLAVTGEKATPPLFATMRVLGQKVILERLKKIEL